MRPAYALAKAFLFPLFSTVWRMKIYGRKNVPMDGPLIFACNHVSYADPPVLGTASPREISYMAKQELFSIPVLGPMIRSFGAYPVDRHGSASAAIKRSVDVLRKGGAIGIFPEGTRNLDGNVEVRQGVALLASLGKAPVVPACVIGTSGVKRLHQIKVVFGEPLRLPEGRKASREEMAKFTDEVMSAIHALAQRFDGN